MHAFPSRDVDDLHITVVFLLLWLNNSQSLRLMKAYSYYDFVHNWCKILRYAIGLTKIKLNFESDQIS